MLGRRRFGTTEGANPKPKKIEVLGQGEQHQDVEWVFDGKGFIIVQARPVTVLPRYTYAEIKDQPDIWSSDQIQMLSGT